MNDEISSQSAELNSDHRDIDPSFGSHQRVRLRREFRRTGSVSTSTFKSGMDQKTARTYLNHPERLNQPRPDRDWRRRVDQLALVWSEAEPLLRAAPKLEAKALLEHLMIIRPSR